MDIRLFKNDLNSFAILEFEEDPMAENAVRALGDPKIGLSKAKVRGRSCCCCCHCYCC